MGHQEPKNELHPFHLAMLLLGGVCTGTGILNLYWSFGRADAEFNGDFRKIGFSALDDVSLLSHGQFALPLIAFGVLLLVTANATAWRETDGY